MEKEEIISAPQVSDEEQALVLQSYQEFQSENHVQTLKLLEKLQTLRGVDLKVLHNKAVVEYFRSKMTQTDEFKTALRDLAAKVNFIFILLKESSFSFKFNMDSFVLL